MRVKSLATDMADVARFNIGGRRIYVAEDVIGLLVLAELANV